MLFVIINIIIIILDSYQYYNGSRCNTHDKSTSCRDDDNDELIDEDKDEDTSCVHHNITTTMVEEKEEEEEASSSKQQLRVEKRRLRGIKDRLIKRQQNIKHVSSSSYYCYYYSSVSDI